MLEQSETKEYTHQSKNPLGYYAVILILLILAFGAGFTAGEGKVKFTDGKIEINKGTPPATSADYSLLWDALDILNTKYVDRPLDQQKLMYGAVEGMVAASGDPYTVFLDPDKA